jgi:hypothetical protein
VRDGWYLEEEIDVEKLILLVKDHVAIYDASSPTKYNGILMFVPGIFLTGGTFKLPELNALPKFVLLKTLLTFSRPRAPTSISVKQQFASATPKRFTE